MKWDYTLQRFYTLNLLVVRSIFDQHLNLGCKGPLIPRAREIQTIDTMRSVMVIPVLNFLFAQNQANQGINYKLRGTDTGC